MKSQIILFIFFLQFNQFQLNNDFPQIIIIEKQPRDEFPNIPIQYSTQPKTYCFHINTALQFNWASPSDFNISKVPSIQIYPTITKQIGSSFHNITPIIDNLKLNNITIKNFLLNIVYVPRYYSYESGIGFAYKFEDEHYSLMHRLYYDNYIPKMQFSIIPRTNKESLWYITIGGIPEKNKKKGQYEGKCYVNKAKSGWGCHLKAIHYGNLTKKFERYALFQTALYPSVNSYEFKNWIDNVILQQYFDTKECEIYTIQKRVQCKIEAIEKTGDFIFEFNDVNLTISLKHFFQKERNVYISTYDYSSRDNHIALGFLFMEYFNWITFDYEDHSIQFASDKIKISPNLVDNSNNIIYLLILSTIILCLLSSIALVKLKFIGNIFMLINILY